VEIPTAGLDSELTSLAGGGIAGRVEVPAAGWEEAEATPVEVTASGFTEVGTAALEEAPTKAEDLEIVSTLEDADNVESTTTTEEAGVVTELDFSFSHLVQIVT
jgi:hypothetical protein